MTDILDLIREAVEGMTVERAKEIASKYDESYALNHGIKIYQDYTVIADIFEEKLHSIPIDRRDWLFDTIVLHAGCHIYNLANDRTEWLKATYEGLKYYVSKRNGFP